MDWSRNNFQFNRPKEEKMVLKACVRYMIAGAFVLSSLAAWGQQNLQTMPFGTPIGNDTAKKMAAAAVAEAKKNSWPVCIAIVDYHGELVYFERLDNTQLGSVSVAVDKARTAAKFKRSTKLLEDAVAGGRNAILRLGDATPIQGGLPIVMDGKFVGAIGVSGVTSQQDEQVASAGLNALK
jgi:uncharacterized protein GlcG (DUF336 family)